MLFFFGGALAVLLLYSLLLSWGWHRRPRPDRLTSAAPPPISVVVAARNESDTLPTLLEALAEQSHPSYEVVIVDDASTDATAEQAVAWAKERSYAQVVQITDPTSPRKKNALTRGIRAARHDVLAITDADCSPPSEWLSELAMIHARSDDDLVLVGHSPLRGSGLLGLCARYETLVEALYMVAAIGLGRPYMAVGRNLSYPRSVFNAVDGFSHCNQSMSGDDDLFLQAVRRQGAADVQAVLDERTFVPSTAPASWKAWYRQHRRHVSAGRYYDWDVSLHLALLHGSLILLWLAPFFVGTTGLGLLATGLLARHSALGPAADTLGDVDLLALFPLWELGYALYHLLIAPIGLLFPPSEW